MRVHGPVKSPKAGIEGPVMEPPTLHIPSSRRDYAKSALGAENPLAMVKGKPANPGFGKTGLTGET